MLSFVFHIVYLQSKKGRFSDLRRLFLYFIKLFCKNCCNFQKFVIL
nr:MAG TPA: hypothetical protein [Caudoviricetes sp.]